MFQEWLVFSAMRQITFSSFLYLMAVRLTYKENGRKNIELNFEQ